MKKSLCIIICFFTFIIVKAQHSCCLDKSATMAFADLGSDESFRAWHIPPAPLDYKAEIGKMVKIKTPDGTEAGVFEVKSGPSSGKIVLMFHEWWGLNDYILREAEMLHKETGYTVLALDLYDGKTTTDPAEAAGLMKGLQDERARAIISGAIDYAGRNGKIQTIGWCMGGAWSLQAAIMAGPQAVGCVMYYGMPETDPEKIAKLQAPVLGIFAEKDQHITKDIAESFREKMKAAGKKLTIFYYPEDHAFANPSNPQFSKASTEDARKHTMEFIRGNFPGTSRSTETR